MRPTHWESYLAVLREELRKKGYKMTRQRRAVLEELSQYAEKHFSSEELYVAVNKRSPGIGIATIYRTLPVLEQLGYLRRIPLHEGFVRYELCQPDAGHAHHHLICTACNAMVELTMDALDELERQASRQTGYRITDHQVLLYGICKDCQNKDDDLQRE